MIIVVPKIHAMAKKIQTKCINKKVKIKIYLK